MGIAKGRIWLALHKLFPSSPKALRRIGEACDGHPERLWELSEARSVELFGETAAKKLSSLPTALKEVKEDWDGLRKQGIKVVPFTDNQYPQKLKCIDRFPAVLYVLGNRSLLEHPAVAICGSRGASDAGLRNAQRFAVAASRLGLVVASGYSKGVYTAAHTGVIDSDGRTIVVLAEGMARFKRKGALKDIDDFLNRALIVSQFYPRQTWHVGAAMERNPVICALSDGVAVIEAAPTGGTIAVGRGCLTQGKPLWVIDYDGLPETAAGNQILIDEGGAGAAQREAMDICPMQCLD